MLNIFGKRDKKEDENYQKIFQIFSKSVNLKEESVNLVFATEDEIKKLNKDFRGIDASTDVLSFPYNEDEILGEVVISREKVRENASEQKVAFDEELKKVIIHGFLHLVGYDHESIEKEADRMRRKEEEILKQI